MESVGFIALFVCFISAFVSAKDASTQTSDKPIMLQDLQSLDAMDWLQAGAMYAGICAALLTGRRNWILAVVIVSAIFSVMDLGFPKQSFKLLFKGEPDTIHLYLIQLFGAIMAGQLAIIASSWDSRDPGVTAALMLSNSAGSLIASFACGFDYNKWHSLCKPQFLTWVFIPMMIYAVGDVLYTFRGSYFGKGNLDFRRRISGHILFDALLIFSMAFLYFGYPNLVLGGVTMEGFKANGVHAHLIRLMSTMIFPLGLYALMSLGFQSEKDQRAYIFGRLVMYMIMFPLLGLYQWKYRIITMGALNVLPQWIIGFAALGNLLCAYFNWTWPKLKRS